MAVCSNAFAACAIYLFEHQEKEGCSEDGHAIHSEEDDAGVIS